MKEAAFLVHEALERKPGVSTSSDSYRSSKASLRPGGPLCEKTYSERKCILIDYLQRAPNIYRHRDRSSAAAPFVIEEIWHCVADQNSPLYYEILRSPEPRLQLRII